MNLENIKQYWEEARNLAYDLPEERLTTTEFVAYLNKHLPPNWEEMTKTKVNYLRVQKILQPEESGGPQRTTWRYTAEDVYRAILIELLKTRDKLSVQESKIWLQGLEDEQRKTEQSKLIDLADFQKVTPLEPATPVTSAYTLLRNRVIGMLITALSNDDIDVTPPECFIAIRTLNHIPEVQSADDLLEQVKKPLEQKWFLAVSDAFSRLYIYPDYSHLEKSRPEITEKLPSYDRYRVLLQADENQYYEILLGLSDSPHLSNVSIKKALTANEGPIPLSVFPGLSTLLKAAFVHEIGEKPGIPLAILAEIIAGASNAWDYCGILLPEADETEPAILRVQDSSTSFPASLRKKRVDVRQSLTGWSFRYRQIAIVDATVQKDPRIAFYEEEGQPIAAAALPAVTEEQKVVGIIYVARHPSNQNTSENGIIFTDELQAGLKGFGCICADIITREQVELETVRSLSREITHPLIKQFPLKQLPEKEEEKEKKNSSVEKKEKQIPLKRLPEKEKKENSSVEKKELLPLEALLREVVEKVSEGVSLEEATHSWIYLLTLNIQTAAQDSITAWLCQQGVETIGNFLAYRLGATSPLHPLPVGYCQLAPDKYVFAILLTVELPEETYKKGIIRLEEELDQISIGRLAPVFYPSAVTFRFEELYQRFVDNGEETLLEVLKERTEERLTAGPYFKRGHDALYRADLDQAVLEFEDALRRVPQSWYGHKHLAETRMLQGTERSVEQAVKECREAIKLNPSYASAHCLLADCLAYQGKYGEALYEYEEAIKQDSTRSDFLIRYGLTLAAMTTTEYQDAVKRLPRHENEQFASENFPVQPWQVAIDKFDQARNISSMYEDSDEKKREQRASYHYHRGYAYLQGNQIDKAIEDFIVGRKLAPDDLQLKQAYSYALNLRRKEKIKIR